MKTIYHNNLDELLAELDSNALQREMDKPYCFSMYDKIHQSMDSCLMNKQYENLLEWISYFEKPDSRFHHSAETKRISVLLNFLKAELNHGKEPFVSSVNDYDGFFEQYHLTIFAMRRLELALSEESMEEAGIYLTSIPLNIYAAAFIIANELFENYENLYWGLYTCMTSIWTIDDKIFWLMLLSEEIPSSKVFLELASLYMESGNYKNAYQYLNKISSPTEEISRLISSLKEYLQNE